MLADCIKVFPCQNEQGCVRVSQSVDRDFAQFRVSADEAAELGVQQRSIIEMPSCRGKYCVGFQPSRAYDFLLLLLFFFMLSKHLYRAIVYDDFSDAHRRFWGRQKVAASYIGQSLVYENGFVFLISPCICLM